MARPNSRRLRQETRSAEVSTLIHQNRFLGRRLAVLTACNEFCRAACVSPNLRALLKAALGATMGVARAGAGSILLVDRDDPRLLRVEAVEGPFSERLIGTTQSLDKRDLVSCAIFLSRDGIVARSNSDYPHLVRRRSERHTGQSFIAAPLLSGADTFGVINLSNPESKDHFTRVDLENVVELCEQIGGVLTAWREHEQVRAFNSELRRQLEKALSELDGVGGRLCDLHNYSEAIVQSAPMGLLLFSSDLSIIYANPQAEGLLNLNNSDSEAKRSSLGDVPLHVEGKSWPEMLRPVLQDGRCVQVYPAHWTQCDAEDALVLRLTASPLRNAQGEPVAGLLVVEDASEEAIMERELRVAERQAAAGKLTAHVAHELNNPLDGILRFVRLAEQCTDLTRTSEYLKEIHRGLERMVAIVSELLEFSRQHPYVRQETEDCNELIREAVRAMSSRASDQAVEIRLDLAPHLPRFRCTALYQVFTNVIKNALDAMSDGGQLSISTRSEEHEVVIGFSDTGPGICADVARRIFDPFFTTKPPGQGTGLGLAICHDIVERYHGRIDVISEPGRGTKFLVRVPIAAKSSGPLNREGN